VLLSCQEAYLCISADDFVHILMTMLAEQVVFDISRKYSIDQIVL